MLFGVRVRGPHGRHVEVLKAVVHEEPVQGMLIDENDIIILYMGGKSLYMIYTAWYTVIKETILL